MPRQMASRQQIVQRFDERRRRTLVIKCHAARNLFQVASVLRDRIQEPGDRRFTFSGQHAIHSTVGVPQNLARNK